MSADDIQKAKMRAQFMQSKYRKANSSNESKEVKTEGLNKPSTSQVSTLSTASKVPVRPNLEEHKKPVTLPLKVPNTLETSLESKPRIDLKESLWEKCRRVQILWRTPPGTFSFCSFSLLLCLLVHIIVVEIIALDRRISQNFLKYFSCGGGYL